MNFDQVAFSFKTQGTNEPSPPASIQIFVQEPGTSPCLLQLLAHCTRVAEVEGARERRSPKGQGLLRKEGPPTYAILSRNLVLSRFTRFLKGFHRAFN